ncbi:hypothetical protein VY657_003430 [Salmonella enterica]|uniref:Uncharacterized protein n=3 Tax=Salmonella enterica TaxID=28901 RepID=A0A8F7R676_SALER|nr:hypothetical protein LFZ50_16230 [Salmonella enterica subsp. arizonae serovar 53:-:- str. SA20100345]EAO0871265.1 hypothetical protein [Salmonella enterica]EAW2114618.1 hypothetical protein [Salmonella enterica subsp. enterica]EEH4416921.1 hypothetical protein [Salmonella enterica subsp. arizonae]EHA8425025.1 hypothetical protein [Salmonella enterica subsp. arizonae serovar 41:z4,z23:-]HBJ6760756.1 hypothetical protein [Salmonella enterica subsp. houtenae serovar 48:g,z51:-]HCM1861117.1 hy
MGQVDRVVIPEVLIGGINVVVDHTNYTNLRRNAQVFFVSSESVTVTDNLHNSLHFHLFLCVFGLAMRASEDHNQDPRGIDW